MLIVKVKSSWCWVSGRGRRGWRWMSWKVNDWRTISYWSTHSPHTICWQYSKLMRDVPVSWLSLLITNRHVLVRWCRDWGFCSPPCSPELTLSLDWYSVLEGSDGTIVYSYNPVLQILVNKQYWSYEKIWPTHTWLLTACSAVKHSKLRRLNQLKSIDCAYYIVMAGYSLLTEIENLRWSLCLTREIVAAQKNVWRQCKSGGRHVRTYHSRYHVQSQTNFVSLNNKYGSTLSWIASLLFVARHKSVHLISTWS